MNNKTTVTALNVSVGADNGQSPSVTKHSNSITDKIVSAICNPPVPWWVKIWKQYHGRTL